MRNENLLPPPPGENPKTPLPGVEPHVEQLMKAILKDFASEQITLPPGFEAAIKVALRSAFVAERLTGYIRAIGIAQATPPGLCRRNPNAIPGLIAVAIRVHARKELGLREGQIQGDNDGGSTSPIIDPTKGG